MNVDLEYYRVFYHVCAHGSLAAAAQGLCISQPAVSQAMQQLGKEAGTKLFLRTSKGVQLVRGGELLYHCVKPGAEELLEGGKVLERALNMDVGEVRIGASDMTLQFYLLPYLEQFRQEYPRIEVNVTNAPTPETIKSLEGDRIDFGVVTSPFTSRGTARQFQVKAIHNVFIAGNGFWGLEGRELGYEELKAFPYIALEKDTSIRTSMGAFLAQQRALLKPELKLAISDMIMQSAGRNMGIKCTAKGFAGDAVTRGEVFRLRFKHEMPFRHMCVVMGESSLISMPGRRLLDMMVCGQAAVEQPAGGR